MKKVAGLVAMVSFLLLVGTMGAFEQDTISMTDFIVRNFILFPVFGYSLYKTSECERW